VNDVVLLADSIDASEFERRFKKTIFDRLCPMTVEEAQKLAQQEWDACSLEDHASGGYEADPEGAAEEAMSYWEAS